MRRAADLDGDVPRREVGHRHLLHIVGAVGRKAAPAADAPAVPLHVRPADSEHALRSAGGRAIVHDSLRGVDFGSEVHASGIYQTRALHQGDKAHQEGKAIQASSTHGEVQVVDEGGLGGHCGRVVVPDERHRQGPSEGLQAVLVGLPCGEVGQVH